MLLVPLDYTGCAHEVMAVAARLAGALGAELTLLYAVDSPPNTSPMAIESLHQDAHEALSGFVNELADQGLKASIKVMAGPPAAAIVAAARQSRAELIVMGTHGRTGLRRLWSGSVAEEVLRQSPCPVTVVRTEDASLHPGPTEAQVRAMAEAEG